MKWSVSIYLSIYLSIYWEKLVEWKHYPHFLITNCIDWETFGSSQKRKSTHIKGTKILVEVTPILEHITFVPFRMLKGCKHQWHIIFDDKWLWRRQSLIFKWNFYLLSCTLTIFKDGQNLSSHLQSMCKKKFDHRVQLTIDYIDHKHYQGHDIYIYIYWGPDNIYYLYNHCQLFNLVFKSISLIFEIIYMKLVNKFKFSMNVS